MSALAVSNDVLRASLRPPAPASLGTRLERRLAEWFPTFQLWLIRALYWFVERAPWQRGTICATLGALIGLSAVLGVAAVFRWERGEGAAAAPIPHAVERAAARAVAPKPPVPAAAAAARTVREPAVPEQVSGSPASETAPSIPAVQHRRKHGHSHSVRRAQRSR